MNERGIPAGDLSGCRSLIYSFADSDPISTFAQGKREPVEISTSSPSLAPAPGAEASGRRW